MLSENLENSAVAMGLEKVSFHSNPKERWCQRMLKVKWSEVAQSCLTLCDPMGFSRQEYWSGLPFPSPGDLHHPGIQPTSLKSPAQAGGFFTSSATWEAQVPIHVHLKAPFLNKLTEIMSIATITSLLIHHSKLLSNTYTFTSIYSLIISILYYGNFLE